MDLISPTNVAQIVEDLEASVTAERDVLSEHGAVVRDDPSGDLSGVVPGVPEPPD